MERRGLWATVATIVVGAGVGAFIGGVTAHILWLTVFGLAVSACGLLILSSLLWGWPARSLHTMSDGPPDPLPATDDSAIDAGVLVIPSTPLQRIYQLQPSGWLGPNRP